MKKVIIITGATSGIGETTALYLSNKGFIVYSLSRRIKDNPLINYISCDVTNIDEVEKAIKQIYEKEKRIDGIINNAGIGISGAFEHTSEIDKDNIINVNLKGVLNIDTLIIPYLKETKGRIIHIGSIAGELAIPFQTYYSLLKSAIHTLNDCLAMELKPFNVKVCLVMPGDTKTGFTKNRVKNTIETGYEDRIKRSIEKMEHDEQNGTNPISVSKVIYKCLTKKRPKEKVAVGFVYKLFLFLNKILPHALVLKILYSMYGK